MISVAGVLGSHAVYRAYQHAYQDLQSRNHPPSKEDSSYYQVQGSRGTSKSSKSWILLGSPCCKDYASIAFEAFTS